MTNDWYWLICTELVVTVYLPHAREKIVASTPELPRTIIKSIHRVCFIFIVRCESIIAI